MILGIYGASGFGQEVFGFASGLNKHTNRWDEIIFIDDAADSISINDNIQVIKFSEVIQRYSPEHFEIVIAQGEPLIRKKLSDKVESNGYKLATLIHPRASISSKAILEAGVVVNSDKVTISPNVVIKKNTFIQPFVAIGHDTIIGENCIVSAFASIAGGCIIGNNTYVSMHTAIKEKTVIGENCIIGMGAMVTRNVPDNYTVFNKNTKMVEHELGTRVFGGNV